MAPRTAGKVVAIQTTKTTESKTLKTNDNNDGLRVRGIMESKVNSPIEWYKH